MYKEAPDFYREFFYSLIFSEELKKISLHFKTTQN